MAVFDATNLKGLIEKFNSMPAKVNAAAADTINRASTFAIKESIKEITNQNNLTESYLKSKIRTVARASKTKLRVIIHATDRRTLLSRFPFTKQKDGVSVRVGKGTTSFLKRAFVVTLRNGNGKGVALSNTDYLKYLKNTTPELSTKRPAKLAKAITRIGDTKRGIHVLHAPSVNQMFKDVKEEIEPELRKFMTKEFFRQFKKKLKK